MKKYNDMQMNISKWKIKNKISENFDFIPTGFKNIDQLIGGWRLSELSIIGARPGMGKTSFALSMILNTSINQIPIAYFSFELNEEQIINRLINLETGINTKNIEAEASDRFNSKLLNGKLKKIEKLPLFIECSKFSSISEFKKKCIELVNDHGVKIIIIDYLQLTVSSVDSLLFCKELRKLAQELDISIIALSQVSREVESRPDKRPEFFHDLLIESENTTSYAGITAFLYRPDYYKLNDIDGKEISTDYCEFIIANKYGLNQKAILTFNRFGKFS